MEFNEAYEKVQALRDNLERVIRGKSGIIDLVITALLAKGHLLIEDVPGVGKTTLAHGLARSVNCTFQRIQFTSDLLPSDVIGVTVYNQPEHRFEFRRGPLFANIVLADEINRGTPKTQSALLEAMNDRQVSVERITHALPEPFMLLATQNPMEFAGTFALPESQLDRFTLSVRIGYPDSDHEKEIIRSASAPAAINDLRPVVEVEDLLNMQELSGRVHVEDDLVAYILSIAEATRNHKEIRLGVSPRATMTLFKACQARSIVSGRDYATPDDIKGLAESVFAHRIIPAVAGFNGDIADSSILIRDILSAVAIPI
ncbi:MAG: AAA family ATPase [Thermodesulfobacteriota bacterium]